MSGRSFAWAQLCCDIGVKHFDATNLCTLIMLYLFRILYPFLLDPISVQWYEPNVALYTIAMRMSYTLRTWLFHSSYIRY